MVLKRIGAKSFAKVMLVLYGVFGIISGVVTSVASVMSGNTLGIVSIVVIPFVYAILGFVGGYIVASVYNIVAGKIGGIEIDIDIG